MPHPVCQNWLWYLAQPFHALFARISCNTFLESMKHIDQPWVGFVSGAWHFIKNCLAAYCVQIKWSEHDYMIFPLNSDVFCFGSYPQRKREVDIGHKTFTVYWWSSETLQKGSLRFTSPGTITSSNSSPGIVWWYWLWSFFNIFKLEKMG